MLLQAKFINSLQSLSALSYVRLVICIVSLHMLTGCADLSTQADNNQATDKAEQSCGPYPSYYLKHLDDTQCKKALPSNRDRDFTCPVQSSEAFVNQSPRYMPIDPKSPHTMEIDPTALASLLPPDAAVSLILVRRVNGVPHYRYLGNGRHNQIVETWSSSKFLGIINASETLRYYSDGQLGLDSIVDGVPVGDLATVVHNYDEETYTSNGLMYWFHDVGGRFFANELIHQRWLHRPDYEIFGANYGAKPEDLGFQFIKDDLVVDIKQDQGWTKKNVLSTMTLAEALKRLVMFRENPETRLQYSTWEDMKVLFYGAQNSIWYDQSTPQGMESDTAVYMQNAVDINALDVNTKGQWRIFSKLGLGFSRGGEIVHTDYACLPVFDSNGYPIMDQGAELIISIHLPVHEQYAEGDQKLADIYQTIVQGVLNGDIR